MGDAIQSINKSIANLEVRLKNTKANLAQNIANLKIVKELPKK
jgi:hypothetical protein